MRYLLLLVGIAGCGVDMDGLQSFGAGGYGGALARGASGGSGGHSSGGTAGGVGGAPVAAGGSSTGGSSAGTGGATPTCAAGLSWSDPGQNNGAHRPGSACGSCHSTFTLSGTVYATPGALTDCFGVDGTDQLSIQVTDAVHVGRGLKVNAVGNFWTMQPIAFPVTVGVAGPNGDVFMQGTAPHGDCNACHTSAAGRVLPPS